MAALIRGPFAGALERDRSRFNALFAQARALNPTLRADAFGDYLRDTVAPIVETVAQVRPERVDAVSEALYTLALELTVRELPARYPIFGQGLRLLLGNLARHLAAEPRRLAGSAANALYNLSLTPGARPVAWIEAMAALGAVCPDTGCLLEAGKIAAWRAGMAHYRQGALEIGAALAEPVTRLALGLSAEPPCPPLALILERLRADPWQAPAAITDGPVQPKRLRLVRQIGAFRGFGGLFLHPPRVALDQGQLLVGDGGSAWVLCADVFGATFSRAPAFPAIGPADSPVRIDRAGAVAWGAHAAVFSALRDWSAFACDGQTLAVTVPYSHAVSLLAITE